MQGYENCRYFKNTYQKIRVLFFSVLSGKNLQCSQALGLI